MIRQKVKIFNLGSLKKTKVTASSGLILIMSFAKEIGLIDELEKKFSHLKKRKRVYSVSKKILSFVEMLIKGGRRLNDIDILSSDLGLLDILEMDKFPRANTLGDLVRRFTRRDIDNLAEIVMKLSSNTIRQKGLKEIVIDIDSSLIPSEVEIAENVIKEEKEGFAVENILSEDFLANAAIFQMQLLAYNLVQYFKYSNLKRSWWNLRIKQLRFRLIMQELWSIMLEERYFVYRCIINIWKHSIGFIIFYLSIESSY